MRSAGHVPLASFAVWGWGGAGRVRAASKPRKGDKRCPVWGARTNVGGEGESGKVLEDKHQSDQEPAQEGEAEQTRAEPPLVFLFRVRVGHQNRRGRLGRSGEGHGCCFWWGRRGSCKKKG